MIQTMQELAIKSSQQRSEGISKKSLFGQTY